LLTAALVSLPKLLANEPDNNAKQEPSQPEGSKPPLQELVTPKEAKHEEIKELIAITHVEESFKALVPEIFKQLKSTFPQVSEKEWGLLQTEFDVMQLVEVLIPIYERHLSREDVQALLAFYRTALGQKLISIMPQIMQEGFAAGQQWGVKIGNRIAERVAQENKQSSQSVTNNEWIRGKTFSFTKYQETITLQKHGYNPDVFRIDPDTGDVVERRQIQSALKPQAGPAPITLPAGVRYIIQVRSGDTEQTFYSEKEPKPFGNGFKFISCGQDLEMVVTGNIQIIKIGKE